MKRATPLSSTALLTAAVWLLGACGPAGGGGVADPGAGGSNGGGAGGSGGQDVVDPGVPETPDSCATSVPGSRLLRRLTRQELLNTHAAVFPQAAEQATTELPADGQGAVRLSNDAATLVMGSQMAEAVLDRAEEIATLVTAPSSLAANLPCAAQADAACATTFIDQYGSALFRRPIAEEERSRYLTLFNSVAGRSDFATGLKWTLVSLIQSPHSVYRSELGQGGQLTPYELASEIAYNYSASPPSQELIALAVSGALADPETRVAQARALLATPGGQQVVHQFFTEWLSYDQASSANRANAPDNFLTIRSKMVLETQRFLEDVLYTRNGTFAELLTADYTYADAELSAYYGFSGGTGDIYAGGGAEVQRTQGLGIFAQGSVLTSMASVEITSPTRRGLLLFKRLYCQVPGAPEAVNFDLGRSDVQGNTTREKLENSHLATACQGCHAQFDPLGFAFEHFDHVGRYRTHENTDAGSFPIDAVTAVALLDNQVVSGQEELVTMLAQDPEVLSCVSATMERYVYGSEGSCRAKDARSKIMAGNISVLDYLADLAREPHVVSRQ